MCVRKTKLLIGNAAIGNVPHREISAHAQLEYWNIGISAAGQQCVCLPLKLATQPSRRRAYCVSMEAHHCPRSLPEIMVRLYANCWGPKPLSQSTVGQFLDCWYANAAALIFCLWVLERLVSFTTVCDVICRLTDELVSCGLWPANSHNLLNPSEKCSWLRSATASRLQTDLDDVMVGPKRPTGGMARRGFFSITLRWWCVQTYCSALSVPPRWVRDRFGRQRGGQTQIWPHVASPM